MKLRHNVRRSLVAAALSTGVALFCAPAAQALPELPSNCMWSSAALYGGDSYYPHIAGWCLDPNDGWMWFGFNGEYGYGHGW